MYFYFIYIQVHVVSKLSMNSPVFQYFLSELKSLAEDTVLRIPLSLNNYAQVLRNNRMTVKLQIKMLSLLSYRCFIGFSEFLSI